MTLPVCVVVGPSGAGKDTILSHACQLLPNLTVIRRVITRPATAGGEAHEAVTETEFSALMQAGAFVLWWQAHRMRYGLRKASFDGLAPQKTVVFNGSRSMLTEAAQVFPHLRVLHVTASEATLAARLRARGREDDDLISARLERARLPLPEGLEVTEIDNSGSLDSAVTQFIRAIAIPPAQETAT